MKKLARYMTDRIGLWCDCKHEGGEGTLGRYGTYFRKHWISEQVLACGGKRSVSSRTDAGTRHEISYLFRGCTLSSAYGRDKVYSACKITLLNLHCLTRRQESTLPVRTLHKFYTKLITLE